MDAEITPYSPKFNEAYFNFAKKAWGKNSYQSTPSYIKWLYYENPSLHKKEKDFLLIVTKNKNVVGCIHKLRMSWISEGVHIEIPAVHNLYVDEQYRGSHALPLMLESFNDDEQVLIPGAIPPVSTIYEKLKSQVVYIQHYRKILRPINGIIQKITKIKKNAVLPYYVPSEKILNCIIKTVAKRAALQGISVDWNVELLRWRFFHDLGPRHFMVYRELPNDEIDFMIVSLGPRRGLNVARIIECSIQNEKNAYLLTTEAEVIAKEQGAHVFFAYGFDKDGEYLMNMRRWRKIDNSSKTYFYHKNKNNCFARHYISMSCTDFGFEAIKS